MIEINLLPHRYRQVESTPAKIGIAFVVGIILVAASAIYLWTFYLSYSAEAEQLVITKKQHESLSATEAKLAVIEKEYDRQQKRKNTVVKLFKSRMLFAPRLARLQALLPETIMLESITCKTSSKRDKKSKSSSILRTFVLTGIVRAASLESEGMEIIPGQDGKDDKRMRELSRFVDSLQDDTDGFYKDCVGKIQYAPIMQSFKTYMFYYDGNPEAYQEISIPVFTFGLTIFAQYTEKAKSKAKNSAKKK